MGLPTKGDLLNGGHSGGVGWPDRQGQISKAFRGKINAAGCLTGLMGVKEVFWLLPLDR